MDIIKEQFEKYEAVRTSGVTNMWAVDVVASLSGLEKETIMEIMKTYGDLNKKFPDVRKT